MDDNYKPGALEKFQKALNLTSNADKISDTKEIGNAYFTLYLAYKDGDVPYINADMDDARDALIKGIEYHELPSMIELMTLQLDQHPAYEASPTKENGLSGTELGKALNIDADLLQGIDIAKKIVLMPEDEDGHKERKIAFMALEDIYDYSINPVFSSPPKNVLKTQFDQEDPFCHQNLMLQISIEPIIDAKKQIYYSDYGFD